MAFLFLQVFTIIFAIVLALKDKWPVIKFADSGASKQMLDEFHDAGAMTRIMFAFALSASATIILFLLDRGEWYFFFLFFFLLMLWMWLVFDIALNKFRGKKTFYVGNEADLDKLQRKLGRYAGQIKAGVCLIVIIALNILYYTL
jgi:hypothetical protein